MPQGIKECVEYVTIMLHLPIDKIFSRGILDFTITLTEDIRKNLGVNLEKLPVNVDINTYWKITPQKQEHEEY